MSLREVSFGDLEAVGALYTGAGWPAPSLREWERMWVDNPAVRIPRPAPCRGWVMEHGGRVVGFLGSLPQLYQWQGQVMRAASAVSFVVLPEFRAMALQLVTRFVKQPHVDLLLGTTATPQASRLLRFLQFNALPEEDGDTSCYWVTGAAGFLAAACRKRGVTAGVSRAIGLASAGPLSLMEAVVGHRPAPTGGEAFTTDVVGPDGIGVEFDDLWMRVGKTRTEILAVRDRETLRHRFAAASVVAPVVVRAWKAGTLVGYGILVRSDNPEIALKRRLVADLLIDGDDPRVAAALLAAAYDVARGEGSHVLEAMAYSKCTRALIEGARPRMRRRSGWPFLFKAPDPALHAALTPASWYATLYDGDRC